LRAREAAVAKVKKIRVLPVALASWRSAFAAAGRMPALFAAVTLLLVFLAALEFSLLNKLIPDAVQLRQVILPAAIVAAFAVLSACLLSPLAIAVHRFIILGEVSHIGSFTENKLRYLRFALFAAALAMLAKLPILQMGIEMDMDTEKGGFLASALVFTRYAIPVLSVVFVVGTMILFPAVAVDAHGTSVGNAFSDSWPNLGRITLVVISSIVPAAAIHFCISLLVTSGQNAIPPIYAFIAVRALPGVLYAAVLAASASYIYTCYAQHIGRPPDLAER
jgi:hypothetical protein